MVNRDPLDNAAGSDNEKSEEQQVHIQYRLVLAFYGRQEGAGGCPRNLLYLLVNG